MSENSTTRLEKLAELYEKGILTKEEFDAQKKVILEGPAPAPQTTKPFKLPAINPLVLYLVAGCVIAAVLYFVFAPKKRSGIAAAKQNAPAASTQLPAKQAAPSVKDTGYGWDGKIAELARAQIIFDRIKRGDSVSSQEKSFSQQKFEEVESRLRKAVTLQGESIRKMQRGEIPKVSVTSGDDSFDEKLNVILSCKCETLPAKMLDARVLELTIKQLEPSGKIKADAIEELKEIWSVWKKYNLSSSKISMPGNISQAEGNRYTTPKGELSLSYPEGWAMERMEIARNGNVISHFIIRGPKVRGYVSNMVLSSETLAPKNMWEKQVAANAQSLRSGSGNVTQGADPISGVGKFAVRLHITNGNEDSYSWLIGAGDRFFVLTLSQNGNVRELAEQITASLQARK